VGEIRIGTSGWHYPSGRGTWDGIFYPARAERGRGFDELAFYAARFNAVEINSTFYGQPRANVSLQWVRRTPPGFEFAVKLYQKFTHPSIAADPTAITAADVDQFKAGIEPLAAAGRLGPVLAQFPPSFHESPAARQYLEWLLDTFADYPLAVELRHRSWSDREAEVRKQLDPRGAAWAQIDEPKFSSSIRQDFAPNTDRLMYVRLHGRNASQWWDHDESEDRYNYVYSEAELRPIVARIQAARTAVRKLYLFLNNHFSASAVADAAMVRHMLDEPVTEPMPAELVDRFPMLEGKVATLPRARLL
jgi:uncharacterized protein YecE (DUF72 family)